MSSVLAVAPGDPNVAGGDGVAGAVGDVLAVYDVSADYNPNNFFHPLLLGAGRGPVPSLNHSR